MFFLLEQHRAAYSIDMGEFHADGRF